MDRLETNLALQAGRFWQNNGLSPAESIRIKSLLQDLGFDLSEYDSKADHEH